MMPAAAQIRVRFMVIFIMSFITPFFPLAELVHLERPVQERGEAVHKQYGVTHTLRVPALQADKHGYRAAADAEDELRLLEQGYRNVVGGHEERAQDKPAREQCKHGVAPEYRCQQRDGAQERHRYVPGYISLVEEVDRPDQERDNGDFPERAASVPEEHLGVHLVLAGKVGKKLLQALFLQYGERRGGGGRVHAREV